MPEFDLVEFDKRVAANAKRKSDKMKSRYRYAKDMGFSAAESVILQNRSEEVINMLAKERKEGAGAK